MTTTHERPPGGGRPRDERLDRAIVDAAVEILREAGSEGVTVAAVAERAGTTRPAVYRRWPDATALAIAALTSLRDETITAPTGDHFADLIAELAAFRDGIVAAGGISLVADMLHPDAEPRVRDVYRSAVVLPRRERLRAVLDAARRDGSISAPPRDRSVAVTMCTGSWYAHVLAGVEPPADWPRRTATLVWRSLGGQR